MSKRTVRLTESDLHNIIKESVKKVLKEEFDPSDWTRNEYGELVPWQYGDYENSRRADRYYLSQDILNGDYDDEILNDWEDWYEELDDDNGWDSTLKDAAKERKLMIDKKYAMNYDFPKNKNKIYDVNTIYWEKERENNKNKPNVNNYEDDRWYNRKNDSYNFSPGLKKRENWNDVDWSLIDRNIDNHLYLANKLKKMDFSNTNNHKRDSYLRNLSNKKYDNRNPDKEKLHTKDSANREIIAMDRKKKQK